MSPPFSSRNEFDVDGDGLLDDVEVLELASFVWESTHPGEGSCSKRERMQLAGEIMKAVALFL